MYGLGLFFYFICCLYVNTIVYEEIKMRPVMDSNLCASFISIIMLSDFWDTLVETEQQQQQQQLIFWVLIMRFKPFLGYMIFVTIRISLMCQKVDLIETESETWKSQMQDDLCHPYILSTTVLSDTACERKHTIYTASEPLVASSLHSDSYSSGPLRPSKSHISIDAQYNLYLMPMYCLEWEQILWRQNKPLPNLAMVFPMIWRKHRHIMCISLCLFQSMGHPQTKHCTCVPGNLSWHKVMFVWHIVQVTFRSPFIRSRMKHSFSGVWKA